MVTIDDYAIDALISVDPQKRAEATTHPIQTGSVVTDHVIVQPTVLFVEGIVSDTPVGLVKDQRVLGSAPANDAYLFLSQMLDEGRLVTVVSDVYPAFKNMLLIGLSGPKDSTVGGAYAFRAEFTATTFASVNTEDRVTLVATTTRRANKKRDKGNVAAKAVSAAKAKKAVSRNQSTFARGVEWAARF